MAAAPIVVFVLSGVAQAEVSLNWSGRLQSDLRFRVEEKSVGDFYDLQTAPVGVSRNENIFKLKLNATAGRFAGVAEVDFVWLGTSNELDSVGDLAQRQEVDPFRLEAHAAYVEAMDLLTEGLDVRIGQQIVSWGKGDQFNPTNMLNARDLEDPLLFGEMLANAMVRVDYTFLSDVTLSGVLVPIFRPALLPRTAPLGTAAVDRLPFVEDAVRHRVLAEKDLVRQLFRYPTAVTEAVPVLPEISPENMQFSFRLAGVLGEQDLALSYYYGRTDLPQPYLNVSALDQTQSCDPADSSRCVPGIIQTQAYLGYPRVQVVSLNMAGQIPLDRLFSALKAVGYRLEAGLFLPERTELAMLQTTAVATEPAGEYDYDADGRRGGPRFPVVDDTPFAKWVFGLDYTFNKYIYMNVQWVHGFPDDYGSGDFFSEGWRVMKGEVTSELDQTLTCVTDHDGTRCARELLRPRQGDYLVLGLDLRLMSDQMLLRLFTIWDLSGIHEESWDETAQTRVREHHTMFSAEGFSAVIYPEIQYNFGHGLELHAGALLMLGEDHTKFGDPAVGGSQLWARARFSY